MSDGPLRERRVRNLEVRNDKENVDGEKHADWEAVEFGFWPDPGPHRRRGHGGGRGAREGGRSPPRGPQGPLPALRAPPPRPPDDPGPAAVPKGGFAAKRFPGPGRGPTGQEGEQ